MGEEHWNGVIGAVVDGTVIRQPMELNQQYHYLCTKVRLAPSPMYKTLGIETTGEFVDSLQFDREYLSAYGCQSLDARAGQRLHRPFEHAP